MDTSAEGNMKIMHAHTPTAHKMLISLEDLRFSILIISGILNNGRATAAISPMSFIVSISGKYNTFHQRKATPSCAPDSSFERESLRYGSSWPLNSFLDKVSSALIPLP